MCPIASFLWAEFVFAQVSVHCVLEIDFREWSIPHFFSAFFLAAFPRKVGGRDRGEAHCDSLRFRRAALSMPHRVHRQPKRDEFGVVAVNPVVFWGASAPSGARCSPCAPARATWPRALQRLCGRTGPTRKLVCPFPDPNPRLRHRLLTLAHALARLTNPAPPQISPRPDFVSRVQARAP